jgi:CheY-like chemotaxis protein
MFNGFLRDVAIPASGPIIMVDDSEDDAFLTRKGYERVKGVSRELIHFADGATLLKHLEKVQLGKIEMPSLILLDVNMPDLDGFEVLQRVRAIDIYQRVPVIVMFTHANDETQIEKAKSLGADGYQVKFFSIKDCTSFFSSLFAKDMN